MVRGRDFIALTCIDPWNQITFNYNTTEWDMAEPFDCRCGTESCVSVVRGYRWLDADARARIAPLLSDHMVTLAGE